MSVERYGFSTRRRVVWPLVVFGTLLWLFSVAVMNGDYGFGRPVLVMSAVPAVLVAGYQWRSTTVLTADGIRGRRLGAPGRWPRWVEIPWRDVAAIGVHEYGSEVLPVVHLNDGGWLILRLPAEPRTASGRDAEYFTGLRDRHARYGTPGPRPKPIPQPSERRRRSVAVVCAVVIVAAFGASSWLLNHGSGRPPEAQACALVPLDEVRRLVPEAVAPEGSGSVVPDTCSWSRPEAAGSPRGDVLTLRVYARGTRFAERSYADTEVWHEEEYVTHPIAGVRGHSWARVSGGTVLAEARATASGYSIDVELRGGLPPAQAEARVAGLVRDVVARLREAAR